MTFVVDASVVVKRFFPEEHTDAAITLITGAATSGEVIAAPHLHVHRQALLLMERYSLSAFDAQYLALAEWLGCDLWVADQKLLRALGGRAPNVRWIGVYR